MTTQYYLKLEQFEGPLDLLLHLIKLNEIDIFNIDILMLTRQYLEYLRVLKYDDLSDAGEFIDMAAALIEIKSKLLLPSIKGEKESDQDVEKDPRLDLQERLIQYETFKRAAEYLAVRPSQGQQFRSSSEWQRLLPYYEEHKHPLIGDSASLVILYEQMLTEFAGRKPTAKVEATTHLVTVEEKITELARIVENVNFALFQGFYKSFNSRYELVVYVLAALELCKGGQVKIHQESWNGPLWIYKSNLDHAQLSAPWVHSEVTSMAPM